MASQLSDLIASHQLPDRFIDTVQQYYVPLARAVADRVQAHGGTLVVGVNGAQGTGKSTLASFLAAILQQDFQLRAAEISIDDLYLDKLARLELAARVHPMLAVRGVPGTHDVDLGVQVLTDLARARRDDITAIPRFDKAHDDRCPVSGWSSFAGRADVIILEGWCVGAMPQPDEALIVPVNTLELQRDANCTWRRYVNRQLAGPYAAFFGLLDLLVMIRAPSFSCVYDWRLLQEDKLRQNRLCQGLDVASVMDPGQIREFIMFYERLTNWQLQEMPARADILLLMNSRHELTEMSGKILQI